MSIHFERDLAYLRKRFLGLGATVEAALYKAASALLASDENLAGEVIGGDAEIDRAEIEVEEECLKILALYQPVAMDLRFIVSVLKMNNDLERMGDHAVNIAKRARYLAHFAPVNWPEPIEEMVENVRLMLRRSLDALMMSDPAMATEVCHMDDIVDSQKRQIAEILRNRLQQNPEQIEPILKMLSVPRQLERIADLATNIAEDVVYMIDGAIIRHHLEDES